MSKSDIIAIMKRGKGTWGKNYALSPRDLMVLTSASTTSALINDGYDGKSPFITRKDLFENSTNQLVYGGKITWVKDYDFKISKTSYIIRGKEYTFEEQFFTLDTPSNDNTKSRKDLVLGVFDGDNNGYLKIVTGEEAATPLIGSYNPEFAFKIAILDVNGNESEFNDVDSFIQFKDLATEVDANGSTVIGNASDPYLGTACIQASNFGGGQSFFIKKNADYKPKDFSYQQFAIKSLTGKWSNNGSFKLAFVDSNNLLVSDYVIVDSSNNNQFGNEYSFESSNNEWQIVTIPIGSFNIQNENVRGLIFKKDDNRGVVDFKLDLVSLQKNVSEPQIEFYHSGNFKEGIQYLSPDSIVELVQNNLPNNVAYTDVNNNFVSQTIDTQLNVNGVLGNSSLSGHILSLGRASANYIWAPSVGGGVNITVNGNLLGDSLAKFNSDNTIQFFSNFSNSGTGTFGGKVTITTGGLDVRTDNTNRVILFKEATGENRFRFYTGGSGNPPHLELYNQDGVTIETRIAATGISYFGGTLEAKEQLHLKGARSFIKDYQEELLVGSDVGGYYLFTGFEQNIAKPINIGDNATSFRVRTKEVVRYEIDVTDNNHLFTGEGRFSGLVKSTQSVAQIDAAVGSTLVNKDWINAQNFGGGSSGVDLTTDQDIGGVKTFLAPTEFQGNIFTTSDFYTRNKANNAFIKFLDRNTTGSEVVIDFDNIGNINAATITGALKNLPSLPVNASTSKTLDNNNTGKLERFSNASPITITINTTSLANIDDICYIDQIGSGVITFTEGAGVTIQTNSAWLNKTNGQFSRVAVQKTGASTYRLYGELEVNTVV